MWLECVGHRYVNMNTVHEMHTECFNNIELPRYDNNEVVSWNEWWIVADDDDVISCANGHIADCVIRDLIQLNHREAQNVLFKQQDIDDLCEKYTKP